MPWCNSKAMGTAHHHQEVNGQSPSHKVIQNYTFIAIKSMKESHYKSCQFIRFALSGLVAW